MRAPEDPRTWDEMISNAVVVTDEDRVRKNSRDDFNLGPGWVFAGGRNIDNAWRTHAEWTCVYVQLRDDFRNELRPHIFEMVGSIEPVRWEDGSWHLFARSITSIGTVKIDMPEPPPEKLIQFFERV